MPIFNISGSVDINGLNEETNPDGAADFGIVYDTTAGINVKVLLDNWPGGGGSGSTLDPADRFWNPSVTSGDASTTGKTITNSVDGDIAFFVNGIEETIGNGVLTNVAYFSSDGGTTPKLISAIVAGDTLYWNGTIAGYELAVTDIGRLLYDS